MHKTYYFVGMSSVAEWVVPRDRVSCGDDRYYRAPWEIVSMNPIIETWAACDLYRAFCGEVMGVSLGTYIVEVMGYKMKVSWVVHQLRLLSYGVWYLVYFWYL